MRVAKCRVALLGCDSGGVAALQKQAHADDRHSRRDHTTGVGSAYFQEKHGDHIKPVRLAQPPSNEIARILTADTRTGRQQARRRVQQGPVRHRAGQTELRAPLRSRTGACQAGEVLYFTLRYALPRHRSKAMVS